jgi:soluble lytic murein transglycosylase
MMLFALITGAFRHSGASTDKSASSQVSDYLLMEGKKLHDAKKYPEAARIWEKLFGDRAWGPLSHILVARCRRMTGEWSRAERVLAEFLKKYPDSPYGAVARESLVEALVAQRKKEALPMLRAMMEKAKDEDKPRLILDAATVETRLGAYKEAAAHLRTLVLRYPATVEGLKAREEIHRLVFLGKIEPPVFSDAEQTGRASEYARKGRFDLASEIYAKLLEKSPSDVKLRLKHARSLYGERKNEEALKRLKALVESDAGETEKIEALYTLSLTYWRLDRDKDFEAACRLIADQGPLKYKRKALFNLGAHYLERGDPATAETYFKRVLAGAPPQAARADVLWKLAWIAYRKKDYRGAAVAFREARSASPGGRLDFPAKYWEARSLLSIAKEKEAVALLKDLAAVNPLGYYGLEAARLLEERGVHEHAGPGAGPQIPELILRVDQQKNEQVAAALKLMERGFPEFALIHLDALPQAMKSTPGLAFLRAKAAHGAGKHRLACDILTAQFGAAVENPPANAPKEFIEIAFPRVHQRETALASRKNAVDPFLVWAVIRQESRYDEGAVSPAGALGLMQVMPQSAGLMDGKGKTKASAVAGLMDPKKNIEAGVKLLAANLRAFGGKIVPAIASYNADRKKVEGWVKRHGSLEHDEFIESIPYLETRQYVKRVLAGYRAYTYLHVRKDLARSW